MLASAPTFALHHENAVAVMQRNARGLENFQQCKTVTCGIAFWWRNRHQA
jgi:hypothetical protein